VPRTEVSVVGGPGNRELLQGGALVGAASAAKLLIDNWKFAVKSTFVVDFSSLKELLQGGELAFNPLTQ
jgi:hypothetical protein